MAFKGPYFKDTEKVIFGPKGASSSVVSDSLRSHELLPARLLSPWNFPGKNARVGCHFLLQGIFLTQGSNPIS